MPQSLLRQMVVVQPYKPVQCLAQVLGTIEVVRAQHLAEPPIETFDHTVGLWCLGLGQSMFNAQALAQLVKLVLSRRLTAATAKQPVGELFTVVCEDGANLERRSLA